VPFQRIRNVLLSYDAEAELKSRGAAGSTNRILPRGATGAARSGRATGFSGACIGVAAGGRPKGRVRNYTNLI